MSKMRREEKKFFLISEKDKKKETSLRRTRSFCAKQATFALWKSSQTFSIIKLSKKTKKIQFLENTSIC